MENVLKWILRLLAMLEQHWDPAQHYEYVPIGNVPLRDGDFFGKTDVVVVRRGKDNQSAIPGDRKPPLSWHHVSVVGELKSNAIKSDHDKTVLQLANYAREVFGCQPNRRWVLAFRWCGSSLRVWRFHRAGASGSTTIDIQENPRALSSRLNVVRDNGGERARI
jgi:hypothetical protein